MSHPTHKTEPKSILKKPLNQIDPTTPDHVVWDETNLAKNEDERIAAGPRMKIDEPKTPYHEALKPDDFSLDDEFSLGHSSHQQSHPSHHPQHHVQIQPPIHSPSEIAHANMLHNVHNHLPTANSPDALTQYQFQHHLGSPPPDQVQGEVLKESSDEEDDPYSGLGDTEREEKMDKHTKFENMRKQHYKMKQEVFKKASNPLTQKWKEGDESDSDSN